MSTTSDPAGAVAPRQIRLNPITSTPWHVLRVDGDRVMLAGALDGRTCFMWRDTAEIQTWTVKTTT